MSMLHTLVLTELDLRNKITPCAGGYAQPQTLWSSRGQLPRTNHWSQPLASSWAAQVISRRSHQA